MHFLVLAWIESWLDLFSGSLVWEGAGDKFLRPGTTRSLRREFRRAIARGEAVYIPPRKNVLTIRGGIGAIGTRFDAVLYS